MTGLSQLLKEISIGWNNAVTKPFTNHPIAQKIRNELPSVIRDIIEKKYPELDIKSSAGAGNWANVPWLSILSPKITTTTQEGIYPAYLFKADGTGVYLSLIQGSRTATNLLGKKEAEQQALKTSQYILKSINGLKDWGSLSINLAATTQLGKSYEYSSIIAKYYPVASIPNDEQLQKDLLALLEFYTEIQNLPKENIISITPSEEINPTISLSLPKPFILLSGISGSGKTRFVKQQALNFRPDGSNYCLVAVRPDWHEPSDLLGYVSRLGNSGTEYIVTDLLRFIVAAWKEAILTINDNQISYKQNAIPYWLCLDEMNLAPVEQYFADYLSVIETRHYNEEQYHCEPLLNASVFSLVNNLVLLRKALGLEGNEHDNLWAYFVSKGISIPPNLIVAGTVNMDETTHGFSRKVIDRAFTLDFNEFFPNHFQHYFESTTQIKALSYPQYSHVDLTLMASVSIDADAQKSIAFLEAINTELKATPFELAFRALNELLISVVSFNPSTEIELQAVWDDFLMTKVLPRIEGDSEKLHDDGDSSILLQLASILEKQLNEIWDDSKIRPDLLSETNDNKTLYIACRSKKKINWMQNRLANNGFTSFWP